MKGTIVVAYTRPCWWGGGEASCQTPERGPRGCNDTRMLCKPVMKGAIKQSFYFLGIHFRVVDWFSGRERESEMRVK